ncbi:lipid A biosynthesis acyltransferase [Polynucleobacter sp. MWH-UH25E]|nr:lipid A biosynthesis acyltransferase [Polynucleobacter sp. MWH-UH25E]
MLQNLVNQTIVGLSKALTLLPYSFLVKLGYILGTLASIIPSDRNRVVQTNLKLCFPELDEASLEQIARKHWQLLGRSLVEKSIVWHGSKKQLHRMVEVESKVDLCDRKARILVNIHFTGIEGCIVLSALAKENGWPITSGFYQKMKNAFFNQKIIEWRNRFGGDAIDRQGNTANLIRKIRNGNLIIIAPDVDLGTKDSSFVPFFGIPTNTITAVSRLAKIAGAEVCLTTTTLKADGSGYITTIHEPLSDFPTDDSIADTARLNQLFENEIRKRPAEYYWVHKRFKNRPNNEINPY